MAFIGKSPSTVFSAASKIQDFTGDGSTVAFDLSYVIPAGGENSLQVFINNIRQKPGSGNSYTLGLDGNNDLKRITFSEAPAAADEIYVIIPVEATNIKNVSDDSVTTAKLADSAVTNAKVSPSAAIADTKLAQITTSSKVATSAIVQPGSPGVYLDGTGSWSAIDTTQQDTNAFNIGLLGFKMAVNEGLTVFNLVDGVVDEFNDESGTDEAEGSNDYYCGTGDWYTNNCTAVCVSAGFSICAVTEPDTSTAGTNPTYGTGAPGSFTVPTGISSVNFYLWGAGGGRGNSCNNGYGAGGGFTSGTLAVASGDVIKTGVGEGGVGGPGNPGIRSVGGGGGFGCAPTSLHAAAGGGVTAIFNPQFASYVTEPTSSPNGAESPKIFAAAGAGGGTGYNAPAYLPNGTYNAGVGGGLIGDAGGNNVAGAVEQTAKIGSQGSGGGGSTPQGTGGQGNPAGGQTGGFMYGGNADNSDANSGAGGSGFFGGGGGAYPQPEDLRHGGGGSSYYGHPQVSCGATEEGGPGPLSGAAIGGGETNPFYAPLASTSGTSANNMGEGAGVLGLGSSKPAAELQGGDGYVLLTASGNVLAGPGGGSTTIISSSFTSTSVPTNARIVVFEENVDTPTLNTDIIASVSRDGTNFTNATLSDSGYVTGSSGQRILTGQADISGQPSGQSMRWKLALANNTVKIHGVSLQWD